MRDIAASAARDPFDTLVDIVIADDLRTVLWPTAPDDDDAHWALRRALWDDADVLLGGSDAGAHLDRMCGGSYPTQFLADCCAAASSCRSSGRCTMLTEKPARCSGSRDRGRIAVGAHADLVLFDPVDARHRPATLAHDLPGGAVRMTAGVRRACARVFVNGVETVVDGEATGELAGHRAALRPRHRTVTVH